MKNRKKYVKNRLCRCLKKHLVSKYTKFASVDIPGLSFTVTESWCLAPPQIRGETRSSRWKIRNLAPANRSPIISIVIYYMSTGRGLNEWPQNIMENMSTRCRLNVSFVSKKSFQNNWSADEKQFVSKVCRSIKSFQNASFLKICKKSNKIMQEVLRSNRRVNMYSSHVGKRSHADWIGFCANAASLPLCVSIVPSSWTKVRETRETKSRKRQQLHCVPFGSKSQTACIKGKAEIMTRLYVHAIAQVNAAEQ